MTVSTFTDIQENNLSWPSRYTCPLPANGNNRLVRRESAGMAGPLRLRGRDEVWRCGTAR